MPRVVRMKTGEIMDGLAADIGNETHDGFMRGISKTGSKDDNEPYNIDPQEHWLSPCPYVVFNRGVTYVKSAENKVQTNNLIKFHF